MTTKRTPKPVSRSIATSARKILAFAEEFAKKAKYHSELFNSVFGPGAKASEFFSTEAERRDFLKTQEYRRILQLIHALPQGPMLDESYEINADTKRVTKRKAGKVVEILPIQS
jgi:hypothetical protein